MFVLALLVVFLVLNEKEEVLVTVLAPFVDKRFLLPREMVKLNQEGLLFLQRSFPVFWGLPRFHNEDGWLAMWVDK
jgi:hypothetical protein